MKHTWQIVDEETSEGVPSATAELWYNNVLISRAVADIHGILSFDVLAVPDQVRVTSASYKSAAFPFEQIVDDYYLPIEKNVVEGDNVIVTAIRRSPWILFAIGLGLLVLADKNKR